MSAVTVNQNIVVKEGTGVLHTFPVKSGETIYQGTFAGVDNNGLLVNITSTNFKNIQLVVIVADDSGSATGAPTATTSAGSIGTGLERTTVIAGDKTVRSCYIRGIFYKSSFTSITQVMVGQTMYVSSNNDIDDAMLGGAPAGMLVTYQSATTGWFSLNEFAMGDGLYRIKGALTRTSGAGGLMSVANPTGKTLLIEKLLIDVTTASTAASTQDYGVAASAATSSDTLIDGASGAAIKLLNTIVDNGTNGRGVIKWGSTSFVTGSATTQPTTKFVGTYTIEYRIYS